MPDDLKTCSSCGAPLAADVAGGLCARCVFARMADVPAATGVPGVSAGDFPARYKLREEIGTGGFGVVYAAEQLEPMRRRVAIKVIKVGMDTRQVVARFEAERQALALMAHPNIAQVFDAGATASGRPFFVMELVRGHSLTQYCDEHQLGTRERLRLLQKVCHAVQHAHHKGIIHRDLKPSNLLVSVQDGVAEPKVIDFGIAKATQLELTDKTLYTHFQQFVGTPAYMSPEQAGLGGLDVDARTDVYSLGALLYELLTGAAPFDAKTLARATPDEACRLIREVEPIKPSTRVSRLTHEEATLVASRRATDGSGLSHALRGDLDRVVMKALEKDRTRRYATAAALAEDLQHFLDNQPVSARPPGFWYLTRKAAARHRLAFAAGAAVALSLLAGTVISLAFALKAHRLGKLAQASERTAKGALAQVEQINTRLEHENYRSAIQLATARIRAGEAHTAMPTLWSTPEKLRGWEWGYLMAQCPIEAWGWDTGHGAISHLEVLTDGRRLLTAGEDWRITLWDIAGQRRLWDAACEGRVRDACAAPDGRHAAVVTTHGPAGRVTITDLATGRAVFQEPLPSYEMSGVWLREGLFLVGHHGIWRLAADPWRVAERHPGNFPSTLPSAKATLGLGPNPPLLVVSRDGVLRSLNPATLATNATLFRPIEEGNSQDLHAFVLEPAAKRFAYATDRLVWAQIGEGPARRLFTNDTSVRFLQSLPGADWLAVADERISIVRHDGAVAAHWATPFALRQLKLMPDGGVLIGDSAGFVRCYRPEEMNQTRHLVEIEHGPECRNVSFSPSGGELAFMDWRRQVSHHLPLAAIGAAFATNVGGGGVTPVSFDPHGRVALATSSLATPDDSRAYHCFSEAPGFHPITGEYVTVRTNGLEFYDVGSGAAVPTRQVPLRGKAYSVAFARTGQTLLVSHQKGIEWLDLATGQTRAMDFPGNAVVPVALSADGSVGAFMARSRGQEHIVWRTQDDQVLWRQPVNGTPNHLALHPAGKFLALTFNEGRTEVWDLTANALVQRFPSGSEVWGLRFFGRDGNRLLALSGQREIHLWDWRYGQELLRLRTSYLPFAAAFSPNGLSFAVASYNPGVTIYRAVPW